MQGRAKAKALQIFAVAAMMSSLLVNTPIQKNEEPVNYKYHGLTSGVNADVYSTQLLTALSVQPNEMIFVSTSEPKQQTVERKKKRRKAKVRKKKEPKQPTDPKKMIGSGLYQVQATAYDNASGSRAADGARIVEGVLAGARAWFGHDCKVYDKNMRYLGTYTFHDTGYGRDGDIIRGETIDIYMPSYDECMEWGRRTVYIEILE